MREGFYSIFYTGQAGSGILMLCLKGGRIVGADAAGGSIFGTYEENGDSLNASCTFNFRTGDLVTGQSLTQPITHKAEFRLPTRLFEGETVKTDIGTGPINARAEFLSDPL